MYFDESINEHQSLIEYPATDDDRMGLIINFFLYSQPFAKLNIGEITQNWANLQKHQLKHLIGLLIESNFFVVFSKRLSTQFILKDDVRSEMISEEGYLGYKSKRNQA